MQFDSHRTASQVGNSPRFSSFSEGLFAALFPLECGDMWRDSMQQADDEIPMDFQDVFFHSPESRRADGRQQVTGHKTGRVAQIGNVLHH